MNNINKNTSADSKNAVKKMWLHYYNNYLFSHGLISEVERNKMSNAIDARGSPDTKR